VRGRGSGEAHDAVGPSQFLARFLGGDEAGDVGGARKIAPDPTWTVDALRNHDPALIDDFDHAAGRKGVKAQGVLEMIEPSAGDQNGVQSAGAIFNPPGNVHDPLLGRAPDVDFAERETLPGQYLAKVQTIADIRSSAALRRAPNVVTCERKQCNAADEIGQFRLDPPQQGIICAHISRFARYGMAEPAQKMLKISDVIVNLCRKHVRVIERALLRRRLGILPLTPETGRHQSQKGRNDGQNQSQQFSSNAAQQHWPSLTANMS
jgi:hypothetical protein